MAATQKDPVLVVLQLTGGNDYLNTVIPYNNPLYQDNRKAVGIGDNQILQLDKDFGFPSYLAPMKKFWDEGNLAIMHGVGYLDSPRSHFRSMDIWHTCEADKVGTEGWLGRVVREFDPKKENVVTCVSFGPCLFRALSVPGVPVACVAGPLETYGFLPGIQEKAQRQTVLDRFSRMYTPDAGQRRDGVSRHHRPGFAAGRRYPESGADQVQVRSEVSGHTDRPQAEGYRPGALAPISAPACSTATTAASTRMPGRPAACQPVDRGQPRSRGVHGRPARA